MSYHDCRFSSDDIRCIRILVGLLYVLPTDIRQCIGQEEVARISLALEWLSQDDEWSRVFGRHRLVCQQVDGVNIMLLDTLAYAVSPSVVARFDWNGDRRVCRLSISLEVIKRHFNDPAITDLQESFLQAVQDASTRTLAQIE